MLYWRMRETCASGLAVPAAGAIATAILALIAISAVVAGRRQKGDQTKSKANGKLFITPFFTLQRTIAGYNTRKIISGQHH
jgi:hypothetical protein